MAKQWSFLRVHRRALAPQRHPDKVWRVLLILAFLASLLQLQPAAIRADAGWVAYNDCVTGTGQPTTNITTYGISGTTSGVLKKYADGANTAVTATITSSNVTVETSNGANADAGTDAYNTFYGGDPGITSMKGVVKLNSTSSYMDVEFSGLDPAKTYTFATSSNRANSPYTDRITQFTLSGVDGATNASTAGVDLVDGDVSDGTLAVKFCSGYNTANGYVARWTGIQPGSDGKFTVRATVVNSSGGAYGFNVFMLQEEAGAPPVQYTLAASTDGNGSVTLDPAGGSYSAGTVVKLTPVANAGYTFSGWTGENAAELIDNSDGTWSITMDGNKSVMANFLAEPVTYTLTAGNDGHGTVTLNPAGGTYAEGTVVKLTPVAASGYTFSSWSGANAADLTNNGDGTWSITMNGNKSVTANFAALPSTGWTAYNDCAWASGQPEANITKYTLSGSTSGLLKNYATGANTTVTAAITSGGSPQVQTGTYGGSESNAGTDAYNTFHGIADMAGVIQYGSSGWWVDVTFTGLDPAKTYTFATTANRNNTSYTSRVTRFTLSGVDGAANASTTGVTVIDNLSVAFCTGYNTVNGYVARWTGIQPGSDGTFTVRAEANSGTEAYGFSVFMLQEEAGAPPPVQYTLTADSSGNGSVALDPAGGSYSAGTVVKLTPVADAGYVFSSWSGANAGDLTNNGDGTWSITMNGNKSVTANFAASSPCTNASLIVAEDTTIRNGNTRGNYNYGGATTLRLNPYYKAGGTDDQYAGVLLKWDVSSIPSAATVTAASLTFYVTDGSNYAYNLYNMRRAWVEGSNDGATGSGASWNYYGAGTGSWGAAGAQDTSSDRYDTNLWNATAADFSKTGSVTIDLNANGLAVIQGWINGSLPNYGLTIQNYSGSATDIWLAASSEASNEAQRPRLSITYCPGSVTTYTLTASTDGHGSVTLNPAGGSYSAGTVVRLMPVANTGYTFSHWSGANAGELSNNGDGSWSITMNGDKAVTANFSISQCAEVSLVAVDDTYMSSYNNTNNYGAQTYLRITLSSNYRRGALLKWDLSGIPANATVTGASLVLNVSTAASATYNLYSMRRAWVEGTGAGSATGDGATWQTCDGTNAWGTNGAANTATDRYDTNLWDANSSTFSSTGSKTIALNSAGLAVVQGWIADPSSNHGLTIQNYGSSTTDYDLQISSNNHATEANRPRLIVSYCLPSGPANQAPNPPVLVQPADGAADVSTPPTLEATVTDPDADAMDVRFYGRPVGGGEDGGEDFTLIVIPDTQNEAQYYPSVMNTQFQWIADQYTAGSGASIAKNIVFATSVGDIVNTASSTTQWETADAAYDRLDAAGLPYSVGPGNHDVGGLYNNYFGPSRFAGNGCYQGPMTAGQNENNYSFFSASGMNFIIINLAYNADTNAINWADGLLKTYSNRRGIVVQHDILNTNNSFANSTTYNSLKDNPNLFLMLCGHMHSASDGSAYYAGTGDDGHTIHILMTDYQDAANGGNGYLRILRFSPTDDKIYASIYSPCTGDYLTSEANYEQFAMGYDMAGSGGSAAFALLGTDTGVASGANASFSWAGLDPDTEYEWYVEASDGSLATTGPTWSFTTAASTPATYNLTLTVDPAGGGTTTPAVGVHSYVAGTVVPITATAATGYAFDYWTGGVVDPNDATTTVTVDGNKAVTAHFAALPVNHAPTDISLSGNTVAENAAVNTVVGVLSSSDPDAGDAFTYTLVSGAGSADNASFNISGASLRTSASFDYEAKSSYSVRIRTTDQGGLYFEKVFTVTVTNVNEAPVLGAIGNKTITELQTLAFTAAATDPDMGDTLTYSLVGAPAGASINSASGAFTWTPDEAQGPGTYTFTVKVCDNGGLWDAEAITVTVNEVNQAPVLATIGNRSVDELEGLTFTATASDDDSPANTLTYSLVGAPAGASINATSGAFTWTPGEAQGPGVYTFTVRVCDNGVPSLCDEEAITVTVNEVNQAPVLGAIGNKTVTELQTLTFTATATDGDSPANTLTYSLVGAPMGASINGTTGAFTWTPTADQGPNTYTFKVQVCDNGSPSLCDDEQITVTVNDSVVNHAPTDISLSGSTVAENAAVNTVVGVLSSSDPDAGDAFTYTLVSGAGSADNASFNISGASLRTSASFDYEAKSSYSVRIRTTDQGGLYFEKVFTVTVTNVNEAPVLGAIGNKTITELQTLAFTAAATDPDMGDTLTYSLVGAPAGASINSASGAFTWTPGEAQGPGTYTFTVRVCDNGGLCDEETITVTVNDSGSTNRPPVLSAIGNKTVTELQVLTFIARATDPDRNTLTYSLVGAPSGASINSRTGVFSWRPTAAQGPGVYTFTVRVCDNGVPSLCDEEQITVTVKDSSYWPWYWPRYGWWWYWWW